VFSDALVTLETRAAFLSGLVHSAAGAALLPDTAVSSFLEAVETLPALSLLCTGGTPDHFSSKSLLATEELVRSSDPLAEVGGELFDTSEELVDGVFTRAASRIERRWSRAGRSLDGAGLAPAISVWWAMRANWCFKGACYCIYFVRAFFCALEYRPEGVVSGHVLSVL
jgi:hypothetical protein